MLYPAKVFRQMKTLFIQPNKNIFLRPSFNNRYSHLCQLGGHFTDTRDFFLVDSSADERSFLYTLHNRRQAKKGKNQIECPVPNFADVPHAAVGPDDLTL